jgi:hypothetical protein
MGGIVKELNTTQTLNHNLNKTSATEIKRNSEQFFTDKIKDMNYAMKRERERREVCMWGGEGNEINNALDIKQ